MATQLTTEMVVFAVLCGVVVLPWPTSGFALRLYNSDFAVKPLENATLTSRLFQPVRTSTLTGANGRYLRLKPSILPATNRGLNFQPAKLFPVVPGVGSRPGMLWDDCSDYKACKARLIHYLAAKISEQKLNSQIDEERMDSQMEAEKKR